MAALRTGLSPPSHPPAHTHAHVHTCEHTCTHRHTHTSVHTHGCTHVHIPVRTHMCTCSHIRAHTYKHVCAHTALDPSSDVVSNSAVSCGTFPLVPSPRLPTFCLTLSALVMTGSLVGNTPEVLGGLCLCLRKESAILSSVHVLQGGCGRRFSRSPPSLHPGHRDCTVWLSSETHVSGRQRGPCHQEPLHQDARESGT